MKKFVQLFGIIPVILLLCLTLAKAEEEISYVCEETPENGVCLRLNEKVIWQLNCSKEGKPFIAPMCLPDGRDLAWVRPKDHVWHLGTWFSWKYLNGVNYWEPSSGETVLESQDVKIDGAAAEVVQNLIYRDKENLEAGTVLSEKRTIHFSAPDQHGSYTITFKHVFTPGEKDVKVDRTPPHAHGGGYAGLSLRLNAFTSKFEILCANGETEMRKIRQKPADWIEYRDPILGDGVRLTVLKGTSQTRFYAQKSGSYCFVNPCPVLTDPLTIKAGESLELEYEIRIGK